MYVLEYEQEDMTVYILANMQTHILCKQAATPECVCVCVHIRVRLLISCRLLFPFC